MNRVSRVGSALLVAAIAALAAGCPKHVQLDIETYPNGGNLGSGGNIEGVEGTVFRIKQMTPDGLSTVNEFFRDKLVKQRGWTEGPEGRFFDGNMKQVDVTYYEFRDSDGPVDPAKPGGAVLVYPQQNSTVIKIWRYVPKAHK